MPKRWQNVADFLSRVEAEMRSHEVPETRARKLLWRFLTPEQRASYVRDGKILVVGKRYRYLLQTDHNTYVILPNGCEVFACVQLSHNTQLPISDRILTLLLRIQTDEDRFLKIAVIKMPIKWRIIDLCRRLSWWAAAKRERAFRPSLPK